MMRLGVALITMSLMLISMAGVAAAGEGPEVASVDCDAELATIRVHLPENHYVVIVDGDGVQTRVDGPFDGTVELETATYRWTEYGIDDSGETRFKGEGELKPTDCPGSETTSTTAPKTCEDTTTTSKPKKDRDDKPCETTTTTTTEDTTSTTESTTTTSTTTTSTTTTTTTTTPSTSAPENQATTESELTTSTVGSEVESSGETSTTVAAVTSPETLPFTGPAAVAGLGVAGGASVLFGMVTLAAARSQRRR